MERFAAWLDFLRWSYNRDLESGREGRVSFRHPHFRLRLLFPKGRCQSHPGTPPHPAHWR